MYIRVKRKKTTVFLMVQPSDTVLEVKSKLKQQLEKEISDMKLVLLPSEVEMEDAKLLSDLKVENDNIVGLCYRNPDAADGESPWESVDIEEPPSAAPA